MKLISILLIVEQTKELLHKNHDLRHVGSKAFPEANARSSINFGRSRGHERKQENFSRKSGKRSNRDENNPRNNPRQRNPLCRNHDKGKKPIRKHADSTCN